jgi:hypothetical protein
MARGGRLGRPEVGDGLDGWVPPASESERERRGGPAELGRGREIGTKGLLWLRAERERERGKLGLQLSLKKEERRERF